MMMYNKMVQDCFFSPRHVGTLDSTEPRTVHASSGYLTRGVLIDLYLKCNETSRVISMCFKTNGDPYVIASLEFLCRKTVGTLHGQVRFTPEEWIDLLAIPVHQTPSVFAVQEVYQRMVDSLNLR